MTHHPRFDLSISHNGQKLQTLNSTPVIATTSLPYVTLSQTVALRSLGKYECELNFNGDLLSTSVFHYEPSGKYYYFSVMSTVKVINHIKLHDTNGLCFFEAQVKS